MAGRERTVAAAQFYSASSDIPPRFGKEYAVEGLGAIAPTWESRQRYLGTWQASASEDAVPAPADLNPLFFNCAHPDLIVPYLKGDEEVQLVNLTPEGKLEFQLPGHLVTVAARYAGGGEHETVSASLDTLLIEPDDMRATLVWRCAVPIKAGLVALETGWAFNEAAG